MKTLIIDTSHTLLAVGVVEENTILFQKQETMNKRQSEHLLSFVNEAIESVKWKPSDIEKIVITDGPGSYTGMRIGITFAKTFALTNSDLIIDTVDTLLSLSGNNNGFSFIDARGGRIFGAKVNQGIISEEQVYMIEDIKDTDLNFYGDIHLLDKETHYGNVIQHILDVKKSWQTVSDIDLLVPRYIK